MYKKSDPGNLGSPVKGNWPYQEDPPLYYRSYGDDRNYRHHSGLFDFWGMNTDEQEMYPAPNAWIKTRAPVPLGNIPSFEEILQNSEDIVDKWSGSPRTYQYYGNNFMIDGPYGRSDESLDEGWFYNNLVPRFQSQKWLPTEKSLNRDNVKNWYKKYKGVPTLPYPNRRKNMTLWDFMGENMGPNTDYYGTEPSTGGGGVGYVMNSNKLKRMHKNATQQNPININDIEGLVERIKKHRGSMEYNELSLYVEPLIEGSRKQQFKSIHIITLSERLKALSKRLSRAKKENVRNNIKNKMKKIIGEILEKIKEYKEEKKEKTALNKNKKFNWYKKYI